MHAGRTAPKYGFNFMDTNTRSAMSQSRTTWLFSDGIMSMSQSEAECSGVEKEPCLAWLRGMGKTGWRMTTQSLKVPNGAVFSGQANPLFQTRLGDVETEIPQAQLDAPEITLHRQHMGRDEFDSEGFERLDLSIVAPLLPKRISVRKSPSWFLRSRTKFILQGAQVWIFDPSRMSNSLTGSRPGSPGRCRRSARADKGHGRSLALDLEIFGRLVGILLISRS